MCASLTAAALVAAAQATTIKVAIVANPQMKDIEILTAAHFTAVTGITVDYTTLSESALRAAVKTDISSASSDYDAVMLGAYYASQWGQDGNIISLNPYVADTPWWDQADILAKVKTALSQGGNLYAAPFYGEGSFLMYRKDLMNAANIKVPDAPTWAEVRTIAEQVQSASGIHGICLRGKPGWGDLGATFTTVLNTFGGTWWAKGVDDSIGASQVDQPGFKEALDFYVGLIRAAGEPNASKAGYNECLQLYQAKQVAMWYDATAAAGVLEVDGSAVAGLNGYANAPVKDTAATSWLWSWALAIPTNSPNKSAAWDYISWATSKGYIETAASELPGGWAAVPPGTRTSTYANPAYQAAAAAFADKTKEAMDSAPVDNPGTTPRPGFGGVQYVGVPQFASMADACTPHLSQAIAGTKTIDEAITECNVVAKQYETHDGMATWAQAVAAVVPVVSVLVLGAVCYAIQSAAPGSKQSGSSGGTKTAEVV